MPSFFISRINTHLTPVKNEFAARRAGGLQKSKINNTHYQAKVQIADND
jgi:hypothetical protein